MTDEELASAVWTIYDKFAGRLNTAETRLDFHCEVAAKIGPEMERYHLICDTTNNPPAVVAANGLGFALFFIRDGKNYYFDDKELKRWHQGKREQKT